MEPSKFATMLRRKTNRITFVLVYAILEWVLLSFLLLNSLFSYLIIKFANYFGLKPPCLLCSRLDHILEPRNSESSYREFICEHHALELSKSGYCFNHRKLVESQDMCEDCSFSHPDVSSTVWVSRWLKEIGRGVKSDGDCQAVENGEVNLRCSCCGVTVNSKILTSHPSSGVLEDTQNGNLISRVGYADDIDLDEGLDQSKTGLLNVKGEDGQGVQSSKDIQMGSGSDLKEEEDNSEGFSLSLSKVGYSMVEADEEEGDIFLEAKIEPLLEGSTFASNEKIPGQHLEFYVDHDDYRLIPVELVNLELRKSAGEIEVGSHRDQVKGQVWRETDDELVFEPDMEVAPDGLDVGEIFSSCLGLVKSNEPKIEDLLSRQCQEEEMKREVDGAVKLDETNIEELPAIERQEEQLKREVDGNVEPDEITIKDLLTKQGQGKEEEIKKEIDAAEEVDESKGEKLPVIHGQAEETKRGVDLEVAGDPTLYVSVTASDDHATDGREVTELDVNNSSADYEDVSNKESDEIDILNVEELVDKIHVVEPSASCKEGLSTIVVICETSTTTASLPNNVEDESKHTEEERGNQTDIAFEISQHELKGDVTLSHELNKVEEDRIPDTPTSIDSLQSLHRKLLLLGRRESANEESLDGSVVKELEYGDGDITIEELKSELRAERKAFRALYAELEEERSAAAIAANQTMAMINRLQEEKATIEMEALQYQRMMEEQAEYDQEALQLMNEILVKREREKQELEMELEVYTKKLMDYEERERMRLLNQRKDGGLTRSRTSPASCSSGEESDELSIDLNNESREEDSSCKCEENGHHDIPVDATLNLKDSLSGFEEERISILNQLKALEEKLFNLVEEEEHHIGNMKPFEQFYQDNAEEFTGSFTFNRDANVTENESSSINEEHHQERKSNGSKPDQVLSPFNAAALESANELFHGIEDRLDPLLLQEVPLTKFQLDKRRFAIEEEVEQLYERLQALEADREFVKHCISSLRKGDRGLDLLQEILQHLCDLKNVELRARIIDGVS